MSALAILRFQSIWLTFVSSPVTKASSRTLAEADLPQIYECKHFGILNLPAQVFFGTPL